MRTTTEPAPASSTRYVSFIPPAVRRTRCSTSWPQTDRTTESMTERGVVAITDASRSGTLPFVPLPDQLLDRTRQRRLEVDQLRPRRGHDDADHAVVERTHLRLPLDPLLGCHLVGAARLEVLVRDAIDDVQLDPTADEQDLGWVHLGVDRQGNHRVLA